MHVLKYVCMYACVQTSVYRYMSKGTNILMTCNIYSHTYIHGNANSSSPTNSITLQSVKLFIIQARTI